MSSVLKRIASFCLVVGLTALGAVGCGTDPEEACDIVCTKDVECQPGLSKDVCLSACREQVKKEAYADAIVEQSECYEDASCSDLSANVCVPQDQ
jgi:hypothetical protein